MDCVLIGVSDVSTLWRFGDVKEKDYEKFVSDYANLLANHFDNVIVVPDNGVYFDIALEFGKLKNKKPIAFYPDKDAFYGIPHIQKNFSLFEVHPIDGDWYKLNADLTKKATCVICLGFSAGVLTEIGFIKYHQKFGSLKDPKLKNIHLFIDERCIEEKLPRVFEEQIHNIFYFKDFDALDKLLSKKRALME